MLLFAIKQFCRVNAFLIEMLQVSGRENIKPTFQNEIRWLMFSNEMCSKTGLTIRWTSFGHNCRLSQSTPANAGPHGCCVCVCWGREVLRSTKLARHGTQHSPLGKSWCTAVHITGFEKRCSVGSWWLLSPWPLPSTVRGNLRESRCSSGQSGGVACLAAWSQRWQHTGTGFPSALAFLILQHNIKAATFAL